MSATPARTWLRDYIRSTGSQPTAAEVAEWMGIRSATARVHLERLVADGELVAYLCAVPIGRSPLAYRLAGAVPSRPVYASVVDRVRDAMADGATTTAEIAAVLRVTPRRVRWARSQVRS